MLVKVPADFIGSVLGESEKKTLAALEEARGSVLVIDEAYGLHAGNRSKDPYKVRVAIVLNLFELVAVDYMPGYHPSLTSVHKATAARASARTQGA